MKFILFFIIFAVTACQAKTTESSNSVKDENSLKCKNEKTAIYNFIETCKASVNYEVKASSSTKSQDSQGIYCKCLEENFNILNGADEKCDYDVFKVKNFVLGQKARIKCNY